MKYRPRILIADCHEDVLIALEYMLENAGYDTTTAWTGRDVIKLLDRFAFDVILLNEYLPDGDAEKLLRAIRRRGIATPSMIMQPSAPPMLDPTRFRALGVVAIVCKHSPDDLLDRLHVHVAVAQHRRTHDLAVPA